MVYFIHSSKPTRAQHSKRGETIMLRRMFVALFVVALLAAPVSAKENMRALIIEGQNNHGVWPKTSQMMKHYLEETGLFTVDIARTAAEGTDPDFHPDFSQYA